MLSAPIPLSSDEAAYFLKLFRRARYHVLNDAEDFRSICFALEELGCRLKGQNLRSLSRYKNVLSGIVPSCLEKEFKISFNMVVSARNEASHRGVFARNLANKSLRLCIAVEEGLRGMIKKVRHLMSENIVVIEPFFSLAKVREIMLENSFSYLPIMRNGKYYFLGDYDVAKIWHANRNNDDFRYNTRIENCIAEKELLPAHEFLADDEIDAIIEKIKDRPALVFNGTDESRYLVGILAPFDLL